MNGAASKLIRVSQRSNRPGDFVFALLFLSLSAILFSQIGTQVVWKNGTTLVAQPAFWPGVGLAMMVGFGFFHALSVVLSSRSAGEGAEIVFWAKSLEFVFWLIVYIYVLPWAGYMPSTAIFAITLAFRVGYRGPKNLGLAAFAGFIVVLVFRSMLSVKLPTGKLYSLLPDPLSTFLILNF